MAIRNVRVSGGFLIRGSAAAAAVSAAAEAGKGGATAGEAAACAADDAGCYAEEDQSSYNDRSYDWPSVWC
jgi:hypothetical protein